MAQAYISSSPPTSLLNATAVKSVRPRALLQPTSSSTLSGLASSFKRGSPLQFRTTSRKRDYECHANSVTIRCEQGAKNSNGLDVWLGRLAMIGFASALSVEVATGKGLLENFGFVSPMPTLALVVTALIGLVTAFFIFQSSSEN